MNAPLLIAPAELVVVRDMAVMNDGKIGVPVPPERLRVTKINHRFGREPGVTNSVPTVEA